METPRGGQRRGYRRKEAQWKLAQRRGARGTGEPVPDEEPVPEGEPVPETERAPEGAWSLPGRP